MFCWCQFKLKLTKSRVAVHVTLFFTSLFLFGTGIKFWNKNRHNYQQSNFDHDVIISKNRIFQISQFSSMLNLFTMAVYTHSVDFIISMFPCIQNLSIEWIKLNIIFFHVLTLILSKYQRQFKLTLAVGENSFFFFQKTLLFLLLYSILL